MFDTLSQLTPTSGVVNSNNGTDGVLVVANCTLNATSGAAASVVLAISANGANWIDVATVSLPSGTTQDGAEIPVSAIVPGGWYWKLTAANATLGAATVFA